MDRTVDQIADELYALPPQAFTAARDEQVARARNAGDPATAKQLAALKRPTVVGFLVNLIALTRPDDLSRLLTLAGRMQTADGALLRELSATRRREIDALLALAVELARTAGVPEPSRAQLAEVESTLSAALVDAEANTLVRTGRVLKTLSYGGFGPLGGVDLSAWSPAPAAGPPPAAGPAPAAAGPAPAAAGPAPAASRPSAKSAGPDPEALAAAAQARAAAEDRVNTAQAALDDARTTESEINAEIERLTADLERIKSELDAASRSARTARQARLNAEKDLASAERRRNRVS